VLKDGIMEATSPEQVQTSIRPHALRPLQATAWFVLSIIVPWWWLRIAYTSEWYSGLNSTVVGVVLALYLLLVIGFYVVAIRNWRGSQAYLTDQRLIIQQRRGRNETLWALPIDKIEKAEVTYPSPLARALRLGHVTFRAGDEFAELKSISHPERLVNALVELSGTEAQEETVPMEQPTHVSADQQVAAPIMATTLESPALVTEQVAPPLQPETTPALIASAAILEEQVPDASWHVPEVMVESMSPSSFEEAIELHEGEPVYL